MGRMSLVIPDLSATTKQTPGFKLDKNRKVKTLEVSWTGTPTGVLTLEVSNSSIDGTTNSGLWLPYSGITMPAQPAGAPGSFGLELVDFGWMWARFSWAFISGTGALNSADNEA